MYNFFNLLKFTLSYYLKPRFASKKDRNKFIIMIVVLGLCFLLPAVLMIFQLYLTTGFAIENNILAEFLSAIFLTAQIGVFFIGTSSYIGIMYFSKDNMLLASMPIKSTYIYLCKLIVSLLSMVAISSLITIPTIIAVAIACANSNFLLGPSYYILGIIGIIGIPLIPLLIISILSFPLMKLISYLKKKPTLMAVISALFTVGLLLAIYIPMFSLQTNIETENGAILPESMINSIVTIGKYAYPTYVLSKSMLGLNPLINFVIFLAITAVSTIIGILLSNLFYKNTISKLNEGGIAKNNKSADKEITPMSLNRALLVREFKFVSRDSQLLLQTLMMLILAPVMIVLFLYFLYKPIEDSSIPQLMYQISKFTMAYFYTELMMGINYLSSIAISREGNKFILLKTLPVEPRTIIKIKLLFADLVSIIGCLLCTIVFAIFADSKWYLSLLLFVSTVFISISTNTFGIYRDLKKPTLKWINVKDITKNNFSALIPSLVSMAPGFIIFMLGIIIPFVIKSETVVLSIIVGLIVLLNILYYFVFRFKKIDKMVECFNNIEP